MSNLTEFHKVSPWRGLQLFIFNRNGFIRAAISHGMAVNLESPGQLAHYQAGTYPKAWEEDAQASLAIANAELSKAIRTSFMTTLAIALIGITIAFLLGLLATSLPMAWGKIINATGVLLAAWATLFALGTPVRSWKGKTLPELIHPKIFIAIFIPGLLLSFLGQLW
jgi:hypothetical protein